MSETGDQYAAEQALRKAIVEVLLNPPAELAKRERIREQRQAHDDFAKSVQTPREPSGSAVDSSRAPVHWEETVIPMKEFAFSESGGGDGQSAPPSAPSFSSVETRICLSDGTVAVVDVLVR